MLPAPGPRRPQPSRHFLYTLGSASSHRPGFAAPDNSPSLLQTPYGWWVCPALNRIIHTGRQMHELANKRGSFPPLRLRHCLFTLPLKDHSRPVATGVSASPASGLHAMLCCQGASLPSTLWITQEHIKGYIRFLLFLICLRLNLYFFSYPVSFAILALYPLSFSWQKYRQFVALS